MSAKARREPGPANRAPGDERESAKRAVAAYGPPIDALSFWNQAK
jgi:hypothetical protein